MRMITLKVVVVQSSSWGASEWLSIVLALAAVTAVYFNFRQINQSKTDNEENRKLTVASINREGRIRIYSNSLAALRATLIDLAANIQGVEVRDIPGPPSGRYGKKGSVTRIWTDSPQGENSRNRIRHPISGELDTIEHRAQMDLLGSEELITEIGDWLERFNRIKSLFESRTKSLNEQIAGDRISVEGLKSELQNAKTEAKESLSSLGNQLDPIHQKMKAELTI